MDQLAARKANVEKRASRPAPRTFDYGPTLRPLPVPRSYTFQRSPKYQDEWEQAPAEAVILSKEEMGIEDDAMYRMLVEIANGRDITPEDFDLLVQLDKDNHVSTLDQDAVQAFEIITVESSGAAETDGKCLICLEPFAEQEKDFELRRLPCQHMYCRECIDYWLTSSSVKCPDLGCFWTKDDCDGEPGEGGGGGAANQGGGAPADIDAGMSAEEFEQAIYYLTTDPSPASGQGRAEEAKEEGETVQEEKGEVPSANPFELAPRVAGFLAGWVPADRRAELVEFEATRATLVQDAVLLMAHDLWPVEDVHQKLGLPLEVGGLSVEAVMCQLRLFRGADLLSAEQRAVVESDDMPAPETLVELYATFAAEVKQRIVARLAPRISESLPSVDTEAANGVALALMTGPSASGATAGVERTSITNIAALLATATPESFAAQLGELPGCEALGK
mmetsp:Transcript_5702/g.13232  ORF Transcript_5702/g.13232 Transcript_5702/m.13232 type:complete len:449 (+) Transcript_5702:103-1449(+)